MEIRLFCCFNNTFHSQWQKLTAKIFPATSAFAAEMWATASWRVLTVRSQKFLEIDRFGQLPVKEVTCYFEVWKKGGKSKYEEGKLNI